MGFLSSSVSITRYKVQGVMEDAIMENVQNGLQQNAMPKIEDDYAEIITGWTPFENAYEPDFEKYTFIFGDFFLFSLRIDKKSIPAKITQKYTAIEIAKKLKESGREYLSKNEKTDIKDMIIEKLMKQIPSTPNTYDVLWNYETSTILFFTTQKAANEELETLFSRSFKLKLIRLFPYTLVERSDIFSNEEKDKVLNLSTVNYTR